MDSRLFSTVVRLLSSNLNQSPDNPLQLDRLPDDSGVELDYPVVQDNHQAGLRNVGVLVFLTTLIAPVLVWFGRLVPIPYLDGGLSTAAILFAGVMLTLGVFGRWWPLGSIAIACAVVPILAMLVRDVPFSLSALLLATLGLGVFAASLSTNYVYVKSAAPTPKDTAQQVRGLWKARWTEFLRPLRGSELHLLDALLLPIAAGGLFFYAAATHGASSLTEATLMLLLVAVVSVTASIASEYLAAMLYGRTVYSLKSRWRAFTHAIVEWANYNRLNTRGVGVHRSLAGSCTTRRRLLIGVVAAWACLWVGFQATPQGESSNPNLAMLDYYSAVIEKNTDRINHAPEVAPPAVQIPELTEAEQDFVNVLSEDNRQQFLKRREEAFLNHAAQSVAELRDEEAFGRPADQLTRFLSTLGRVTLQAIVPSLATLIAVGGLLFSMTSRSLAGADAILSPDARTRTLSTQNWESLVARVQSSKDGYESQSVFLGTNARDDTPILVPRSVFKEHAHVLGDSGAGKTTIGLMPLITQLMRFGDSSIVVIDLKADRQFLFESLRAEAARVPEWVRSVRKVKEPEFAEYPFRWFTTVLGNSSYGFNPLSQKLMPKLSPDQRTDILTAALGLQYGTDYGRKYFGDANFEVLNYALKENPNITSLAELERILAGANRFPLPEKTKDAGTNVLSSVRRLARCKALNVCAAAGTPQAVLDAAIDLDQLFTQPQALSFALPPSAGISNTAEIARMVLYSLLAAAQAHVGPRKQVFLIVDEFQRIVSNNVELFLQQARSMNIGCLLSNQSVRDLQKVDADLMSAVRTNTRFRQVLGAGDPEDIRDLIDTSGETIQGTRTWNYAPGILEATLKSMSLSEKVGTRLSVNDILKATDAVGRSITCIRRGEGYAQFGGMPFVMDSVYHIPQEEFGRREDEPWPEPTPATVVATLDDYNTPLASPAQILGASMPAPQASAGRGDTTKAAPLAPQSAAVLEATDSVTPPTDDAVGVTDVFLDSLYLEQQQKAQPHHAKRKKKSKRNQRPEP